MIAEVEIQPKAESFDAFEGMCAALSLPAKSLIAVLTVYLDESYNQPTAKYPNDQLVYTVGCWVSTPLQWKKFGKKWRAALASAQIDFFHMSKYESRYGEYKYWSELKRIGVLKRLHRIIKDHALYGLTLSVNCADYDEMITGNLKQQFGATYYSFDVRLIMKALAEWADKTNQPGPIHYVFAGLNGQGNELDKIFGRVLKDAELKQWLRLSGVWSKSMMREVTQLQAADIVAYEFNKRAVNYISGQKQFIRRALTNLAAGLYGDRLVPLYFGKTELTRLLDDARKTGVGAVP